MIICIKDVFPVLSVLFVEIMTDNLLIIGGTGFIETSTCAATNQLKTTVLSLHEPKSESKVEGAHYLQADTTNCDDLRRKLSNTDRLAINLFHRPLFL